MACENCECYDCRASRGEIEDCDREWYKAQQAGRYTDSFGHFRAWSTENGRICFQYNAGPEYDYGAWEPTYGEEACFSGTTGMLFSLPEFRENLNAWARRQYWRSPDEFRALQDEYNRNNQQSREYYEQSVEQNARAYQAEYARWAEMQSALRETITSLEARVSDLQAQLDGSVQVHVLHEQLAD